MGDVADRLAPGRYRRARLVVLHFRTAAGGRRRPRDAAGHPVPSDAGHAAGSAARPRKEIKCRPFDPSAPHDQGDLGQLAGWLVAEYGKRGGDELGKVIADWCGTEHSFLLRIQKVYTELCARYSPVVISGPASPFVSVSAVRASKHAPDPLAPAESRGSVPFTAASPHRPESSKPYPNRPNRPRAFPSMPKRLFAAHAIPSS